MISVDTTKDLGAVGGATTLTVSYTNAGDILFVGALCTSGDNITGVTFNGVAMTKVGSSTQIPSSAWLTFWYLKNPAKTTANIVVTTSVSTTIVAIAASYNAPAIGGLDQTGSNTESGGTTLSKSLTTTKDNAWSVAMVYTDGFNVSAGASTTLRIGSANRGILDSNGAIHPAGSTTLNASFSGAGGAAMIMCDFYENPATGMMVTEI